MVMRHGSARSLLLPQLRPPVQDHSNRCILRPPLCPHEDEELLSIWADIVGRGRGHLIDRSFRFQLKQPVRHGWRINRVERYIHSHHFGVWRNEKQLLSVLTPAWVASAVDGQVLIPSGWRHRLNVDFIPARLIGGESDEFAVGRDFTLAGVSLSRANWNRLLASVQRKKSHSTRSQLQH